MILETKCSTREADGVTWISVEAGDWLNVHQELYEAGFSRFEWMTAVHEGDDDYSVYCHLSNDVNQFDLDCQTSQLLSPQTGPVKTNRVKTNPITTNQVITSTRLTSTSETSIASLSALFPVADFHERETRQLLGVNFVGGSSTPAFQHDFQGYPLRRDFALHSRRDTPWPGAVEPDAQSRRRPQLPPGVFPEWGSDG